VCVCRAVVCLCVCVCGVYACVRVFAGGMPNTLIILLNSCMDVVYLSHMHIHTLLTRPVCVLVLAHKNECFTTSPLTGLTSNRCRTLIVTHAHTHLAHKAFV